MVSDKNILCKSRPVLTIRRGVGYIIYVTVLKKESIYVLHVEDSQGRDVNGLSRDEGIRLIHVVSRQNSCLDGMRRSVARPLGRKEAEDNGRNIHIKKDKIIGIYGLNGIGIGLFRKAMAVLALASVNIGRIRPVV